MWKSLYVLNYIEHLLILISAITECVSTFYVSPSLVGIRIRTMSSAIGLKFCVINSGIIIKYKSIINKQNKKHNKIVLLAKSKLNSIEVLTSNVFIGSNISHDEFILINNVVEEFYDMMEKIKNSNDE